MATVIYKDGKTKQVKNLAWLIRHSSAINFIEIYPQSHFKKPNRHADGRMIATLVDGTKYIVDWASLTVCRQWLKNRNWSNVTVKWY